MRTLKPPVPPKPSTLETPKKRRGFRKAALSEATKGFLKSIGIDPKFIDDDDKDESQVAKGGKGKQPKKIRKTETERLTEG